MANENAFNRIEDKLNTVIDYLIQAQQQASANQVALVALLEAIQNFVNPSPPVLSLQYEDHSTMAVVATINLTAGGSPDQVNVEDENGVVLPVSTITWTPMTGLAATTDVVISPSSDGLGFDFTAASGVATETGTTNAVWTDPTGVSPPVNGPMLTVDVHAAVVAPTALEYNEVSGA